MPAGHSDYSKTQYSLYIHQHISQSNESSNTSSFIHMTKLFWTKLRSALKITGSPISSSRETTNGLGGDLNLNEEYVLAFRTKSYLDMCGKLQSQLRRISIDGSDKLSSPSTPHPFSQHLSECLLEPRQDKITEIVQNPHFHRLLIHYFDASLEACNVCELLLRSIHQARSNYTTIQRVIKLHKKAQWVDDTSSITSAIFMELEGFAMLPNPLSYISPQFLHIHDSNLKLLQRLTTNEKKIRRKLKLNTICKKPGRFIGFLLKYRNRVVCEKIKRSLLEEFGDQLDMAARGIFILINDFDMIDIFVRRLHDEFEHGKGVADMCAKTGKAEILPDVVREFHMHQSSFLEQLQELEQHVYLCFKTINKSRMLVIQEVAAIQQ